MCNIINKLISQKEIIERLKKLFRGRLEGVRQGNYFTYFPDRDGMKEGRQAEQGYVIDQLEFEIACINRDLEMAEKEFKCKDTFSVLSTDETRDVAQFLELALSKKKREDGNICGGELEERITHVKDRLVREYNAGKGVK